MPQVLETTAILGYVANNSNNQLVTTSSNDGINWSPDSLVDGPQSSKFSPTLCTTANFLLMCYVANNDSNDLLVTTTDQSGWSAPAQVSRQSSKTAPSAYAISAAVILAYVANNSSNDLIITFSSEGFNYPNGPLRVGTQSSKTAPALCQFKNELILAYVANNSSNDLIIATSSNWMNAFQAGSPPPTWTESQVGIPPQSSKTAPALCVFNNNTLVLAYVANNSSNDLIITTSSDGKTWTPDTQVSGQSSEMTPAISAFTEPNGNQKLLLTYIAANSSNHLIVTTSSDAKTWTPNTQVSGGQSSKFGPALTVSSTIPIP
jgi:hypothetical protein